jgi:hypothetical protein
VGALEAEGCEVGDGVTTAETELEGVFDGTTEDDTDSDLEAAGEIEGAIEAEADKLAATTGDREAEADKDGTSHTMATKGSMNGIKLEGESTLCIKSMHMLVQQYENVAKF